MEINDFIIYTIDDKAAQRPKISKTFIESFDMAPIFLIDSDAEPSITSIPEGTSPVGITSDCSFDKEAMAIKGTIFLKPSIFESEDNYHVAGLELGVLDGENINAEVVDSVVRCIMLKKGLSPYDQERKEKIDALEKELEG